MDEAEVLRRLKGNNPPANKEALHRVLGEHIETARAARAKRRAQLEPLHEALRSVAMASKDMAPVRTAVAALQQQEKFSHPRPARPVRHPAPQAPWIKLGSIHVVDTPPFQTLTSVSEVGNNNIICEAHDDGFMEVSLGSGQGDAHADCWAAVGQQYSPMSSGQLRFRASASIQWQDNWTSFYWREAAGSILLGQTINRFDSNWSFIDTPINHWLELDSFDDYNFADVHFSGLTTVTRVLESDMWVDDDINLECWMWVEASENANGGDSSAGVFIQAQVAALVLDLFT